MARSVVEVFTVLGADVTLVGAGDAAAAACRRRRRRDDLDAVVDKVDVLYLLRMQRERMHEALVPSLREYSTRFGLTPERARACPTTRWSCTPVR